jgi:L,D-transpeptidase ErfK/SrfK
MIEYFFPLPVQAGIFESEVTGIVTHYKVQPGDTLYKIARRFDLGIVEVMAANPGVDTWLPKEGASLVLPTMHVLPTPTPEGIVINLAELRLFYFHDAHTVMTFPIGIGKEGWQTPTGTTTIAKKRVHPSWTPPDSIRAEKPDLPKNIPAGPDNPLGDYALNLGWSKYLIHGTNKPAGIGRRSSHGCIRMYPEDISQLFNAVKVGTDVTIIDTPYKTGWRNDTLFLKVTPTQQQADAILQHRQASLPLSAGLYEAVMQNVRSTDVIDWTAVQKATTGIRGIPVAIARRGN